MKTKILSVTILALALSALHFASGQEEFSFKLYMESLANGKKDTLELGIFPDTYYFDSRDPYPDSLLQNPVYDPFADTANIGAYVLPNGTYYQDINRDGYQRVYPPYVKRFTGLRNTDMYIIVPCQTLPVKLTWDSVHLSSEAAKSPLITDWTAEGRPDAPTPGLSFNGYMDRMSGMTLYSLWQLVQGGYDFLHEIGYPYFYMPHLGDSIRMHVAIEDSTGKDHIYKLFFISLGYDATIGTEETIEASSPVAIFPNPVSSTLNIRSCFPLQDWKIYDISGRLIAQGSDDHAEVNCQGWPDGLYFLSWKDIQGNHGIQKIIKR